MPWHLLQSRVTSIREGRKCRQLVDSSLGKLGWEGRRSRAIAVLIFWAERKEWVEGRRAADHTEEGWASGRGAPAEMEGSRAGWGPPHSQGGSRWGEG